MDQPSRSTARQLRHPDPEVRKAAREEVASTLVACGGDEERAARLLGITVRTVRKWGHRAPVDQPEPSPEAESDPSPFADFLPRHQLPMDRTGAPEETPPGTPEGTATATSHPPETGDVSAPPSPAGAELPWYRALARRPPSAARTSPGAREARTSGSPGPRRLAFVLHAHLPWVLGHGSWPHGEQWLAEAVTHAYLPLLAVLRRQADRGHRHLLTLSISPVLATQLADPRLAKLVEGYLAGRTEAARELRGQHPLAEFWEEELHRAAATWREVGGDLIEALRHLESAGVIELSTCAATHPYLPLLHRRGFLRLQIAAACHNHRRLFGRRPLGLWMPECAYRPAGPWRHPLTGAEEPQRPGNETFLAEEGIQWTVVDTHLVLGGEPIAPYALGWLTDDRGEVQRSRQPPKEIRTTLRRLARPVLVGDGAVAALVREPHTARQVWARQVGYPGDPAYLEFHKRHSPSGLRLWRVTDAQADLADKLPYWPQDAATAVEAQADHFLRLVTALPELDDGLVVCPFDAELFGHWWYEGPRWLEAVLERTARHPLVRSTTPRRELARHPVHRRLRLPEGSWGEGGDHRTWANGKTTWMWEALADAERRMEERLTTGADPRTATVALKQLMLAAASDWPFLVTTEAGADYAADRFRRHLSRFTEAIDGTASETPPSWWEEELPLLEVRPGWWRPETPPQEAPCSTT